MGNLHGQLTEIMTDTLAEVARKRKVKYNTLWKKAKRKFPSEVWAEDSAVLPEHLAALFPEKSATKKTIIRIPQPIHVHQPAPAVENTPAPGRAKFAWRTPLLVGLMIAPTAASVENMYSVTFSLSASAHSAIFLTAVLSVSALGFVVAGVRNWYTVGLAALLIAYESFCNLTRIYGGLMGNGSTGNPTRFLGTVTDIFNTGTHGTAIFLGAFTAFFIAAVQYAAVFELNKGK